MAKVASSVQVNQRPEVTSLPFVVQEQDRAQAQAGTSLDSGVQVDHIEQALHMEEHPPSALEELGTSALSLGQGMVEQAKGMALALAARAHQARDEVEPVRLSAFGRCRCCFGAVRAGQALAGSTQDVATALAPFGRLCRGQTSSVGPFW